MTLPTKPKTSPLQPDQPVVKRPHSPDETMKDFKTQRSISDALGPVMDQVHLVGESGDSPDGGWQEQGATDSALMNEGERVKDLVLKFESTNRSASATCAEEQGSFFSHFQHGIKEAVKDVGHMVIEGITGGVKEIVGDVEKAAHKIRCVLPQSSMEDHPNNNIHVPHPSIVGSMVGLGMKIIKHDKGHLVGAVISDGFAEKAKIKENDIITSVNDTDVACLQFEELQQLFGNMESVEFKLVIIRQDGEDEDGHPLYTTVTITIKLSLDGDQVVVDIEVKYSARQLSYISGDIDQLDPYYIIQEKSTSSEYLSLDDSFCGTTTTDVQTTKCQFKMLRYRPYRHTPCVLFNVAMSRPVDLGVNSRIGMDSTELYGTGIDTSNDKRFFYRKKQLNTNMFVFELMSRPNIFLTVEDDGTLAETEFSNINCVTSSGLFRLFNIQRQLFM